MMRNTDTEEEKLCHTYTDHANDVEEESALETELQGMNLCRAANQNFTARLYELLSLASAHGIDHIVSWQPHGRAFLVKDKEAFEKNVLPRWFQQSKLSSFQRQLNLYGFMRLHKGPDEGGYYHELFLRGKPLLCRRIQRIRVKGNGARKSVSHHTQPDFYKMAPMPLEGQKLSQNVQPEITPDATSSCVSQVDLSQTAQNAFDALLDQPLEPSTRQRTKNIEQSFVQVQHTHGNAEAEKTDRAVTTVQSMPSPLHHRGQMASMTWNVADCFSPLDNTFPHELQPSFPAPYSGLRNNYGGQGNTSAQPSSQILLNSGSHQPSLGFHSNWTQQLSDTMTAMPRSADTHSPLEPRPLQLPDYPTNLNFSEPDQTTAPGMQRLSHAMPAEFEMPNPQTHQFDNSPQFDSYSPTLWKEE